MPDNALDGFIEEIVKAKRIVVFGLGREGLQMRGFAMRLFHMGRDVAVWGDMTTPALGRGDLFIASAGPGDLPTAQTLVDVARKAGARTALVTAQPEAASRNMSTSSRSFRLRQWRTIRVASSRSCRWGRCSRPRR